MRLKRFDLELSEAVRQHPCLYNRSDDFFNHREYVASCWENVAANTGLANGENFDYELVCCGLVLCCHMK